MVPSVYQAFKCCGKHNIESPSETFDESILSSEELNLLTDVYVNYGKYTGIALKEMTHQQGSPWDKVYEKGFNHVIPLSLMKEYFEQNREFRKFELNTADADIITEVPIEWDGEEDGVYDNV